MNMSDLIITIGREFGSGGHEIAVKLAEKLGIKCYDKEILTKSSEVSGYSEEIFKTYDESASRSLLFSLAMGLYPNGNDLPLPAQLYMEQFKTIKEIAQNESCVFVGRSADYVLKDFPNVVSVFVHAPIAKRVERIVQRHEITSEKAEKLIRKTDKDRANYYNNFTEQKWGVSKYYDLSLDSGRTGIDGAVKLILDFIEIMK